MKKLISLALAIAMLLSLTACFGGGTSSGNSNGINNGSSDNDNTDTDGGYYLGELTMSLGTPEKALDPETVYANLTYTPEMFYGDYRLLGGDNAVSNYENNMDYIDYPYGTTAKQITAIPYRLEVGPNTYNHWVHKVEAHNWLRAHFRTDGKNEIFANFAYTIEGNVIRLTYLESFNVDEERNVITYQLGDLTLEYTFEFCGRDLTLTAGNKSVTMRTGLNVSDDKTRLYAENYLTEGSSAIDNVDYISFLYDGEYNRLTFEDKEGNSFYQKSIAKLSDNGLFTFTIPWESGAKTYQYVYFLCGRDGMVLTDGENTYYYNSTYADRYLDPLGGNLTVEDAGKIENIQEDKLKEIVEKKEDLFEELEKAFSNAGLNVSVDRKSGEIAMDATVLFGGDSAVLTDAGKALLDKFMGAYSSVIKNEKYDGFISKTMVEGHTAPVTGTTYEDGIPLSEERATVVRDYCQTVGDAGKMETIGYSCGKPIYNEGGTVNMDACRRVSFKFIISLD